MTPLLSSSAGKLAVGLVAGIATTWLLRPAAVGVVRASLAVRDATKSAVKSVTSEAREIHAEAAARRASAIASEKAKVQSEIDKAKKS